MKSNEHPSVAQWFHPLWCMVHGLSMAVYWLLGADIGVGQAPRRQLPVYSHYPYHGNVYLMSTEWLGDWNVAFSAAGILTFFTLYHALHWDYQRHQQPASSGRAFRWWHEPYWLHWLAACSHAAIVMQIGLFAGNNDIFGMFHLGFMILFEHLCRYAIGNENLVQYRRAWWRFSLAITVLRWCTFWPFYLRALNDYAVELPDYAWASWMLSIAHDLAIIILTWAWAAQLEWCSAAVYASVSLWQLLIVTHTQLAIAVAGSWARAARVYV